MDLISLTEPMLALSREVKVQQEIVERRRGAISLSLAFPLGNAVCWLRPQEERREEKGEDTIERTEESQSSLTHLLAAALTRKTPVG